MELNRIAEVSFMVWYTYERDGASRGVEGQRWYTGQGRFVPGARTLPLTLYETTGRAIFDWQDAIIPSSTQIAGTATVTFFDCHAARLAFAFTEGSNAGASGTINLSRGTLARPSASRRHGREVARIRHSAISRKRGGSARTALDCYSTGPAAPSTSCNRLLVLLHLQVALDRPHAFRVTRDRYGLVRLGLIVHRAGHPDDAVLVRVDADVLQASRMLRRELGLDLRRNGRILDERRRIGRSASRFSA